MSVYQEIREAIDMADGVLIGASNGLSIAEGFMVSEKHGRFPRKIRNPLYYTGNGVFISFPRRKMEIFQPDYQRKMYAE